VITGIALAAPAGLNAYIPLLAVAVGERLGWIALRAPFDVLGEWRMIALIAVLLVVEIVADKVPAVDSVNDAVQSVVRPAVGGLLAVATTGAGETAPVVLVVAGVLLAGGMHAAKASARPALNVATAGTAAPVASTAEDIVSAGLTGLAFLAPVLVLLAAMALMVVVAWLALRRRGRVRREG